MEPPGDAVETSTTIAWMDEGIIFSRAKGVADTVESIDEIFSVYGDLTRDTRRPLFFDARMWWGGDPAAWSKATALLESRFTAIAMLVAPETAVEVGPFPSAISRLMIPFHVFTDEVEALAFARGFVPDE